MEWFRTQTAFLRSVENRNGTEWFLTSEYSANIRNALVRPNRPDRVERRRLALSPLSHVSLIPLSRATRTGDGDQDGQPQPQPHGRAACPNAAPRRRGGRRRPGRPAPAPAPPLPLPTSQRRPESAPAPPRVRRLPLPTSQRHRLPLPVLPARRGAASQPEASLLRWPKSPHSRCPWEAEGGKPPPAGELGMALHLQAASPVPPVDEGLPRHRRGRGPRPPPSWPEEQGRRTSLAIGVVVQS